MAMQSYIYRRAGLQLQIDGLTITGSGSEDFVEITPVGGEGRRVYGMDSIQMSQAPSAGATVSVSLCLASSSVDSLMKLLYAQREAPIIGDLAKGYLITFTDNYNRQHVFYDCRFGVQPVQSYGTESMPSIKFDFESTTYTMPIGNL